MGAAADVTIHPSAVVEDGAELGRGCDVGPFCHVGPKVRLADGVVLKSHVVVAGDTEIGEGSVVFPFACLGEIPQDLKFAGESTKLVIGARNRIRENTTMHTGTAGGGGVTRIGDDGLFMANCHIAHDSCIGDRVVIANTAALAGHVVIEDDVIIGGLSGVHQHVRIGRGAMIGGMTMVTHDIIPHGMVQAWRGRLSGLNLVGMRRRGVPRSEIDEARAAFEELAGGAGTFQERARRIGESAKGACVRQIADFVAAGSSRSFLHPEPE